MDEDDLDRFKRMQRLSDPLNYVQRMASSLERIQRLSDPLNYVQRMTSSLERIQRLSDPLNYVQRMASSLERMQRLSDPLYQVQRITSAFERMQRLSDPLHQIQRLSTSFERMQKLLDPFEEVRGLKYSLPAIYQSAYQQALDRRVQSLSPVNQHRIPSIADSSYLFENVGGGLIKPKTWARNALRKGLWTIDDEYLIEYLANNLHTKINPEEYICYYYSNSRWAKLADIIEKWAECKFIGERYSVLKNAFDLLRFTHETESDFKHMIMNTLISQIEGIRRDISEIILPDTLTNLDINNDFIVNKYGTKTSSRNQKICSFISKKISHDCAITFHDVICHGVFMSIDEFNKRMKNGTIIIKFNRHIASHGYNDHSNYGTTENVIRAFLYLDFMIRIISKLNDETYH